MTLAHYMGTTFTWLSKFWRIVHDAFRDGYESYVQSPLHNAEAAYMNLLEWSRDLPESVARGPSCAHHVLIMQ